MDLREQAVRQFTEAAGRVLKKDVRPEAGQWVKIEDARGAVVITGEVGRDLHINSHAANEAAEPWWARLAVWTMAANLVLLAAWRPESLQLAYFQQLLIHALIITGCTVFGAAAWRWYRASRR